MAGPEREQIDEYLRALADPVRRTIVSSLGAGALRAGELAAAAGVAAPAMSRHLRILLAAGVVDDERSVTDARVRLFFLRREALGHVRDWCAGVVELVP
jgi:DNA-binding transcriptional ArsR family regulator